MLKNVASLISLRQENQGGPHEEGKGLEKGRLLIYSTVIIELKEENNQTPAGIFPFSRPAPSSYVSFR
jgi:hypothetical protein